MFVPVRVGLTKVPDLRLGQVEWEALERLLQAVPRVGKHELWVSAVLARLVEEVHIDRTVGRLNVDSSGQNCGKAVQWDPAEGESLVLEHHVPNGSSLRGVPVLVPLEGAAHGPPDRHGPLTEKLVLHSRTPASPRPEAVAGA